MIFHCLACFSLVVVQEFRANGSVYLVPCGRCGALYRASAGVEREPLLPEKELEAKKNVNT